MIPFDLLLGTVADAPRVHHASRALVRSCPDPLVSLLRSVGWPDGELRTAWAVVMRESNGQPHTWSGGAAGLFQLQASAWDHAPWWDWQAVFNARANAAMALYVWRDHGWQPWGLADDGRSMDARDYAGWSDAEQRRLIWQPYSDFYDTYPCATPRGSK